MTLKQVFSITGRPGLFQMISSQKMPFIVEELESRKRLPVFARDKVVSLGDISMYTQEGDKSLGEILQDIYTQQEGRELDLAQITKDPASLKEFMEKALPSYDRDRVHNGDIKKLAKWYNILLQAGMTEFVEKGPADEKEADAE